MMQEVKEFFKNLISSRMFILGLLFIAGAAVLISRIFYLQIVKGDYYQDNFQLKIIRERSISAARGNIYDRNGNLLAYNELAYSVVIEDIFDDEADKNAAMNDCILKLADIIEKNGDTVISDFGITLNQDGEFEFAYQDTKHLRFLADIYGYATIDKLKFEEKNSTPDDVVDYFCKKKKYAIGTYNVDHETGKREFIPREGYTNEEILKLITIRYAIDLNAFKKYVTTTVASDVSDETVAAIYENEDSLKGVTISRDTVRRYKDSVYFSQIIGYTGMISQDEFDEYKKWLCSVYMPLSWKYHGDWTVWQYCDTAELDGYSGGERCIDLNVLKRGLGTEELTIRSEQENERDTSGNTVRRGSLLRGL